MPVRLPELRWPAELLEAGPPQDPTILLSGTVEIGGARHRVLAVRVDPRNMQADLGAELDESIYADYRLPDMLDEVGYFENLDRSVTVALAGGRYVIWMVPWGRDLPA